MTLLRVLGLLLISVGTARAAEKPNVLFLVLEDVSPVRFGTHGNPVCKPPKACLPPK